MNHSPLGGQTSDREGLRQTVAALRDAFPDLHPTIEDMVAEGDRVVLRDIVSGTHQGAFAGIPPTGKRVMVTRIGIFRVADGKIVEYWSVVDMLGMMQQIGAIPASEEARA